MSSLNDVETGRLPDFVIIGAMKSGSTTLYRWLDAHPSVQLPQCKEPDFFSDARRYGAGVAAYGARFARCSPSALTGEASVSYTDPRWSPDAASRLYATAPRARLVCLLRDPQDRIRSHYRHEVLRNREHRRSTTAVADKDSPYVRRSLYGAALEPWMRRFPTEQLHVVCFERLIGSQGAWDSLLGFLGLESTPIPTTVHNAASGKPAFTPLMRILWELGLAQRGATLPKPLLRALKWALVRPSETRSELIASCEAPLPPSIAPLLRSDMERLRTLFPGLNPPWAGL